MWLWTLWNYGRYIIQCFREKEHHKPIIVISSPPYAAHKLLHGDISQLNESHKALAVTAPYPFYHPLVLHQPFIKHGNSLAQQNTRIQDLLYRKYRSSQLELPSLRETYPPRIFNENKTEFNEREPYVVFALRMPGFAIADISRTDLSGTSQKDLLIYINLLKSWKEKIFK